MQKLKQTPQTKGRHLNHVAWLYDPLVEKMSFGRERRFRETTLEIMGVNPHDHVLDIGCGTGSLTTLIADNLTGDGEVIGLDAAPRMITIARKKALRKKNRAQFIVGIAEKLDFPDRSFDLVVNSMFTHHIDRELKKRAFAEMYRVLKPGGRLCTADIDKPTTFFSNVLGWASRYILFQPELEDNLCGKLPEFMAEANFQDIKKKAHLYGMVSFFVASKRAD